MAELSAPRFEQSGELQIAGLSKLYPRDKLSAIPDQWNSLALQLQFISGRVGPYTYGVWYDVLTGGGQPMTYVTGVRVGAFAPIHPSLSRVVIPAQQYAVFRHQGPLPEIRRTIDAIFSQWLPQSGYSHYRHAEQAPDFLERYAESAEGGSVAEVEIWTPVTK